MPGSILLQLIYPHCPVPETENGYTFVNATTPQVHVSDLGLLRGDGIFETLGFFHTHTQALEPHLKRLQHSANLLDLAPPHLPSWRAAIKAATEKYIATNPSSAEAYIKLLYTRGLNTTNTPNAWVLVDASIDYVRERQHGLSVITLDRGYKHNVAQTSPWLLTGAKTLSYAINQAAAREAKRKGADDAIFLSSDEYVLEGPTSSLVFITQTTAVTPATNQGILAGTTQAAVFDFLDREGFKTEYRQVRPEELLSARAVWLVSSVRQAAPILRINDIPIATDSALTQRLNDYLEHRKH